jgi:uncharacterized protein involved in exopolysaccharide biosynthesis
VELREYVSQMGWRLWILVALPLVSAGVTFSLLADTPAQYRATSVLTVPSTVTGGSSSGSVAQYMANFEQTIVSEPVIERVVEDVGAEAGEIRDGLDTTQLGNSSLIQVSYQGPVSDEAAEIVEVATGAAFNRVAEIQLPFGESIETLESRLRQSTSELNSADAELEDFLVKNGLVLPREEYLMVAADVSRLESEISRAESEGTSTSALEDILEERRQELTRLGKALPEYERLRAAVDRAEEDVDDAQDELRLTENRLGQLEPEMTDVRTESVGKLRIVGRGIGVAAGMGFIAALALIVLFPSRRAQHTYETIREPTSSSP